MSFKDKLIAGKIIEFLDEDIGYGDITSDSIIPRGKMAKATLYFRENGVVSGLDEVSLIFEILGCSVKKHVKNGESVKANQTLLDISGPAKSILLGERTALNIISRMAGIATTTHELIQATSHINPNLRVAATRKTLPGWRTLDKKAVEHGGGDPHRFRLDDCVLIKDNHLELLPSITDAVTTVRRKVSFTKKIEVEVDTITQAEEAARAGADIIMLDNMNPTEIKKCLNQLEEKNLLDGILIEASGGVTPDNIVEYAKSGVDIVSLGYLTHSVRSLDVKLEMEMM